MADVDYEIAFNICRQELAMAKSVLKACYEKLMLYHLAGDGNYVGGIELSELNRRIIAMTGPLEK